MEVREEIRKMLSEADISSIFPTVPFGDHLLSAEAFFVAPSASKTGVQLSHGRIGHCCPSCGCISDIFAFESNWFPELARDFRCHECGQRLILLLNQPGEIYKPGALTSEYLGIEIKTADDVKYWTNRAFVLASILMLLRTGDLYVEACSRMAAERKNIFLRFFNYNEIQDVNTSFDHWQDVFKMKTTTTEIRKVIFREILLDTKGFAPKTDKWLLGTRAHIGKGYPSLRTNIIYTVVNTTNELTGALLLFPTTILPIAVSAAFNSVFTVLAGGPTKVISERVVPHRDPVFSLVGEEVVCSRCGNMEVPGATKKCTNCGAKYNVFKTTTAKKRAMRDYEIKKAQKAQSKAVAF